jgi:hypothetical protein
MGITAGIGAAYGAYLNVWRGQTAENELAQSM